jgi:hypothetical protein
MPELCNACARQRRTDGIGEPISDYVASGKKVDTRHVVRSGRRLHQKIGQSPYMKLWPVAVLSRWSWKGGWEMADRRGEPVEPNQELTVQTVH